jgi:hypothetical protein
VDSETFDALNILRKRVFWIEESLKLFETVFKAYISRIEDLECRVESMESIVETLKELYMEGLVA